MNCLVQAKDFTGLEFGLNRPTDLDAFVCFAHAHEIFVKVELKYGDDIDEAPWNRQACAYMASCRAHRRGGASSFIVYATHTDPLPNPILVAAAVVRWIYDGEQWSKCGESTVYDALKHYYTCSIKGIAL